MTRDRNLQFRGSVSTEFLEFSPVDFSLLSRFSVRFRKEIAPKSGEIARFPGGGKHSHVCGCHVFWCRKKSCIKKTRARSLNWFAEDIPLGTLGLDFIILFSWNYFSYLFHLGLHQYAGLIISRNLLVLHLRPHLLRLT